MVDDYLTMFVVDEFGPPAHFAGVRYNRAMVNELLSKRLPVW